MTLPDPPTTTGHIIITPQSAHLAGHFNAETQTGKTENEDNNE